MGTMFGGRRYNFDWRSFITPGVKLLVLVCAGVFLLQTLADLLIVPRPTSWINHFFGLVALGPIPGLRVWQPFTYIFLHGGLLHLLLNMLFLWMFGRDLELVWGKRRFLNFFFLCGVGAGILEILAGTEAKHHVLATQVMTRDESRKIGDRLKPGDFIKTRLQWCGAQFVHSGFIHAGVEIIADPGLHLAAARRRIRSFFQNSPQESLIFLSKLTVHVPACLIRRNRILLDPPAAGITIEIDARVNGPVHR